MGFTWVTTGIAWLITPSVLEAPFKRFENENVLGEILPDSFSKPYVSEKVNIKSGFYSKDYEDETQEKALIFYQNTYMPSSGTMYASSENFDVVAVYDGKIKSIKTDEILGNVVEISHSDNLTTIYYSLKDVFLKDLPNKFKLNNKDYTLSYNKNSWFRLELVVSWFTNRNKNIFTSIKNVVILIIESRRWVWK